MSAIIAIVVHLTLYAMWWVPAQRERTIRADGASIPFYFAGSIGDSVGFSLTSVAFMSIVPVVRPLSYVLSAFMALVVTYVLHNHWSRSAQLSVVSLYTRNGAPTIAGTIHLVYIMSIILSLGATLLTWYALSAEALTYFVSGLVVYLGAVMLDKARGVI